MSLLLSILAATALQAAPCDARDRYAIIVHGGTASEGRVPEERLAFIREALTEAREELRRGTRAVDVAEAIIAEMEASGLFNAGRGSITNAEGYVENDASIMDGRTMKAGAVASMTGLRSPIGAARIVMDETRHVMMVGDRGEHAVLERGAAPAPEGWFLRAKNDETSGAEPKEHGTVGAAVLDRCGDLAAGTSTGGYDAKIPGRVGDSPVIGAGTYAKNGVVAASATGHGEFFIRYGATRDLAARIEHAGQSATEAGEAVLNEMAAAGTDGDGRGGIVAVDSEGRFATPYTYDGMVRGYASDTQQPVAGAFDTVE